MHAVIWILQGILAVMFFVAAIGLVLTMIGGMILHLRRGEGVKSVLDNILFLLLAAFVAYGRFVLVPA